MRSIRVKHVAAAIAVALALALSVVPAMASITSEGVVYTTSLQSLGGNDWALTVDIDATQNTFGATFLTVIAIAPGGTTFSNVSLFSSSDGTWNGPFAGPVGGQSSDCADNNSSMFCFAANPGASTSNPIELVFHFTNPDQNLSSVHIQVDWANADGFINGHHFSQDVPFGTPEPSSMMLLGSGLLGLVGVIRKKIRA